MNESLLKDACQYIDRWLSFYTQDRGIPGLVFAVQHKRNPVFLRSYGFSDLHSKTMLDPNRTFRIASHSKMFTAIALFQLLEEGALRLDDPIVQHLPWVKRASDQRIPMITIGELASHGAGILRDGSDARYWQMLRPFLNEDELKANVLRGRAVLDANVQFKYSNVGFSILGMIIKRVSGLPYNEYVLQEIIEPLKLTHTGPDLDEIARNTLVCGHGRTFPGTAREVLPHFDTQAMSSATGFYSRAADLCRFGKVLWKGNKELLSQRSKQLMQKIQFPIHGDQDYYGMGLMVERDGNQTLLGHSGGFPGFTSRTFIDPHAQLVVSVLANSADTDTSEIARAIVETIRYFQTYDASPAKAVSRRELTRFEGRFYSPWACLDIVRVNKGLVVVCPHLPSPFKDVLADLEYRGKNSFRMNNQEGMMFPGENLKVRFDKKGKPQTVVMGGQVLFSWPRYCEKYTPLQDGKNS